MSETENTAAPDTTDAAKPAKPTIEELVAKARADLDARKARGETAAPRPAKPTAAEKEAAKAAKKAAKEAGKAVKAEAQAARKAEAAAKREAKRAERDAKRASKQGAEASDAVKAACAALGALTPDELKAAIRLARKAAKPAPAAEG